MSKLVGFLSCFFAFYLQRILSSPGNPAQRSEGSQMVALEYKDDEYTIEKKQLLLHFHLQWKTIANNSSINRSATMQRALVTAITCSPTVWRACTRTVASETLKDSRSPRPQDYPRRECPPPASLHQTNAIQLTRLPLAKRALLNSAITQSRRGVQDSCE